jgi:alanine racemase
VKTRFDNSFFTETGALLEINLAALKSNWRELAKRAHPAQCAAVVKADAYGIGLVAAVSALQEAGCNTFFVAHLTEAQTARNVAPHAVIYVLNGLLHHSCEPYGALNVRPVIGSLEEWREWQTYRHAFIKTRDDILPAALHVDTGMNRLGLSVAEACELGVSLKNVDGSISLLMSHLSSAEDWDDPATTQQIERFEKVRAHFPHVPASLSNSSGLFRAEKPFYDVVRAGYALYGGNPTPHHKNPMHPVVTLKARIIQTRTVQAGEGVGYNGQWTAQSTQRLAVISVGYADGYPRGASATDAKRDAKQPMGHAVVGGVLCPFAGRVSMDLITIDVTNAPLSASQRGDDVTLIGEGLDLDTVAHNAGTIGYEVLTHLGARYVRRYVE